MLSPVLALIDSSFSQDGGDEDYDHILCDFYEFSYTSLWETQGFIYR